MSPFEKAFREWRVAYGFRQAEFAMRLGYEQSYISAIESSVKGSPGIDFISRVVERLELSGQWKCRLLDAMNESHRKIVLPSDVPEHVCILFSELRRQLENLHPAQVKLIQLALRLPEAMSHDVGVVAPTLRRRKKALSKKAEEDL